MEIKAKPKICICGLWTNVTPLTTSYYLLNQPATLAHIEPVSPGQRRESLELKRQQQMAPGMGGYYGPLPGMSANTAAAAAGMSGMMGNSMTSMTSMTPPPSLSGSSTNLPLSKQTLCEGNWLETFISILFSKFLEKDNNKKEKKNPFHCINAVYSSQLFPKWKSLHCVVVAVGFVLSVG